VSKCPQNKIQSKHENMYLLIYLFIYLIIYLLTLKYYYYSWTPIVSEEVSRAASKLLDLVYLLAQPASIA
jgi:hypothetical protein